MCIPLFPSLGSVTSLFVCLLQDYSFSSVRVETPLLLVVNGKPQGSSSQAAATVASRPQCE